MAVTLVPDPAIFDNVSLVRTGTCFMNDREELVWAACYADCLPNFSSSA